MDWFFCNIPDTSERAPPNPSHAGWYSIYLPRRDERLSWPSWLDSAPAGNQTSDLSITSPTPNRFTTKTTMSSVFSSFLKLNIIVIAVINDVRSAISQRQLRLLFHRHQWMLLHHTPTSPVLARSIHWIVTVPCATAHTTPQRRLASKQGAFYRLIYNAQTTAVSFSADVVFFTSFGQFKRRLFPRSSHLKPPRSVAASVLVVGLLGYGTDSCKKVAYLLPRRNFLL